MIKQVVDGRPTSPKSLNGPRLLGKYNVHRLGWLGVPQLVRQGRAV